MTTRRTVIAGVVAGALCAPALLRAEEFASGYAPQALRAADGIWIVRGRDEPIAFGNGGAIANSVLIATDAGTLIVDPGPSLAYGKALSALSRQVTGAGAARVYVTHLHPDHSFGSGAFDPAIVHALPSTRRELAENADGFSDAMYRMLVDWMSGTSIVLPLGDAGEGDVDIGGRTLRLLALNGHSHGDLALLDKATGTLIAGDLLFHDRAPATPHADIDGWLAALDVLEAVPAARIVPGHGPLDTGGTSIAQTREWLTWLRASLREAVLSGKDMSEAGAMAIPERFSSMKVARYELQRSVSHFYPGLEAQLLPRIGG